MTNEVIHLGYFPKELLYSVKCFKMKLKKLLFLKVTLTRDNGTKQLIVKHTLTDILRNLILKKVSARIRNSKRQSSTSAKNRCYLHLRRGKNVSV